MYARTKEIPPGSGNYYAYMVSGHRDQDDNNKVKQEVEEYLGKVSSQDPPEEELMEFEKYREWKESKEEEKEDDLEDLRPTEIAPEGVLVHVYDSDTLSYLEEDADKEKAKEVIKFFSDISNEEMLERIDSISFSPEGGGTTDVGGTTAGEYSSKRNQITIYGAGQDFDVESKKETIAHEAAHAMFHSLTDTISKDFPEEIEEKTEDLKLKKQEKMIEFAEKKKDELIHGSDYSEAKLEKEEFREATSLFKSISMRDPGDIVLEEKYAKELEKKLPKFSELGIVEREDLKEETESGTLTFYPEEIQEEIKNPVNFLEENIEHISELGEKDIEKSKEYKRTREEIKDLIRDFAWYSFEEKPISHYSGKYLNKLKSRDYDKLNINMEEKIKELQEGSYTLEKLHDYDEKPASFLDFVFGEYDVKRFVNENFAESFAKLKEGNILKGISKGKPKKKTGEELEEKFTKPTYIEENGETKKIDKELSGTKKTLLKIVEKAYDTELSEHGFFEE